MQYIITWFLIFIGLIFKKTKLVYFFQFLWIWIVLGWNNGGPDYFNYLIDYNYISSAGQFVSNAEILYQFTVKTLSSMGLDFHTYQIITTFIGLTLISSTIFKYTKNTSFVMSLFMIFPLLDAIIQRQNFIAMSIIIFGIRYLISDKKTDRFKYVLTVIIATGFHISALYYMILIFAPLINFKKLKRLNFAGFVVLLFTLPILPGIINSLLSNYSVGIYFDDSNSLSSNYKSVVLILWQFCGTGLIIKLKSKVEQSNYKVQNSRQYQDIVFKSFLFMLPITALYFYNINFIRYFRNLLPLAYIAFSRVSTQKGKFSIYTLTFISYVLLSSAYLYMISGDSFTTVYKAVFENNIIFDLFN